MLHMNNKTMTLHREIKYVFFFLRQSKTYHRRTFLGYLIKKFPTNRCRSFKFSNTCSLSNKFILCKNKKLLRAFYKYSTCHGWFIQETFFKMYIHTYSAVWFLLFKKISLLEKSVFQVIYCIATFTCNLLLKKGFLCK